MTYLKNEQDVITETLLRHARAAILRYLDDAPGYCLNDMLLRDLLDREGARLSTERLRSTLDWMASEHLVRIERSVVLGQPLVVVELTEKGADVAQARERHPDIAPALPRQ